MTQGQLEIVFDREDRLYTTGEKVSGKVVVEVRADFSSRSIQIDYGWRTHGSGTQDKGSEETISLTRGRLKNFLAGERREIPFTFDVPAYPVTYHGRYVNVDWYLSASMRIPGDEDIRTEEDFLVAGVRPQDHLSNDPSRSVESTPSIVVTSSPLWRWGPVMALLAVSFLIFLGPGGSLDEAGFRCLAILFMFAGFLMIFVDFRKIIFNLGLKQRIDIQEAEVEPKDIAPSEHTLSRIKILTRGSVHLDHITTQIWAEEEASSGAGSSTSTRSYILYGQEYLKPYGEALEPGRLVNYECRLPVPAYAPHTFISHNNSIRWYVRLKITCKGWPSWDKTIPITVSPVIPIPKEREG